MEADDLLGAAWPALAACQENAAPGPVGVPDHVLVRQTVDDCLTEPLDAAGLVSLLEGLESGRVAVHCVESVEPSPLSHGILTGKPYTYLDGAPLEERRTRAVPVPRGLPALGPSGLPVGLPVDPDELGPLDSAAAAEVLDQVRPRPRTADELHDLLLSLVLARSVDSWRPWFEELALDGRALVVGSAWAATERRAWAEELVASLEDPMVGSDEALAECIGGHLEVAGPVSVEELVSEGVLPTGSVRGVPLTVGRARTGLARLEASGSAIALPDGRWCARHLLVRLHAASRSRRRQRVEAATIGDLVRFLACWQHVAAGTQAEGRAGLLSVIEQLQGIEVAAGEWERRVLPSRVAGYDPRWLDELCLSGEVTWGRLTPRPEQGAAGDGAGEEPAARRGSATPSPATPLAIVTREDMPWMLAAVRTGEGPGEPTHGAAAEVLALLRERGACFRSELAPATGRLGTDADEGLWDLVARGLVTADAYSAVRSLLSSATRRAPGRGRAATRRAGLGRRHAAIGTGVGEGRWSLLPDPDRSAGGSVTGPPAEELAEAVAWQLLARWGVVCWELWARESYRVPWRDVIRALRRLEARGQALGGRFVAGLSGEQYASPDAAALLADVRRDPSRGAEVSVAGADPLNLTGGVLECPRVPSVRHREVRYRDGLPAAGGVAVPAR